MAICMSCGKYIPEKDSKPWPETEEELIEFSNRLKCRSFVYCYECLIKMGLFKESED